MKRTLKGGGFFLAVLFIFLVGSSIAEEPTAPEGMVLIPAGDFLYGEGKKKISLKDFYIDKYEVTNEEFKKFRPEQRFDPKEADHPAREISWFDADEYCKWAGERLPTEEEWEKAARGKDGRIYPWGNKYDPRKANAAEMGGKVVTVGSFEKGVSPYGVYDMAGNVWEWTDNWYGDDKKYKVIRGGSYFEPGEDFVKVTARLRSIPDDMHEYIGFRCVKDVAK